MPLLLRRHHTECATPKKLAFGKRLADVLVDHIEWFGLASLDERTGCPIPEKSSKTLKRPHLELVRTRYHVPTRSARSFSLCRRSVYLFFTCLWSGARKSPQKIAKIFTNRNKKECVLLGATPLTKPPRRSKQHP